MAKTWRLILDQKCDGYYNMAVDEAILSGYGYFKTPTLRIYGWNRPFISLGYNQDPGRVLNLDSGFPFVRRMTGGSAILHHREITYSLVCSSQDLSLPKTVKGSYRVICSFIKEFYGRLGLEAGFANDFKFRDRRPSKELGIYGDFCFSSWQHFDFLVKGKKIGGNAQRRKKNIIFQHGSIPQEVDADCVRRAIKNPGNIQEQSTALREELAKPLSFDLLSSFLQASFRSTFAVEFAVLKLSKPEQEKAAFLLKEKYKTKLWNVDRVSKNAQALLVE